MDVCALPLRPSDSLVNDPTASAARRLAEALLAAPEYQAFLQTAQAVNKDEQVNRLILEIRACRASFDCEKKGALQTELEGLPVMTAYDQATQTLRALVADIDRTVSAAAGLEFIANVRPERHG